MPVSTSKVQQKNPQSPHKVCQDSDVESGCRRRASLRPRCIHPASGHKCKKDTLRDANCSEIVFCVCLISQGSWLTSQAIPENPSLLHNLAQ